MLLWAVPDMWRPAISSRFRQELSAAGIDITAIDHAGDQNPVDLAWGDKRPAPPQEPVRLHPMAYAGETVKEKLSKVGSIEGGQDYMQD